MGPTEARAPWRAGAILALAAVVGWAGPREDDAPKSAPAPIPVTRTWHDLLRQPPIDLGGGATIRLGIEATRRPLYSGALLYGLTQGYRPPTEWDSDDRLGPVRVAVEVDGQRRLVSRLKAARGNGQDRAAGTLLFVRAIRVQGHGRHHVRVRSLDGALLAETALEGTREPFHPWMPWALDRRRRDALEAAEGEEDLVVDFVRNRADGTALPHWDPMEPIVFEGTARGRQIKRLAGERLPTLLPQEPDPGLQLQADGTVLTVTSDVPINLSRPDWHFLTRWWVNGKPFVPKPLEAYADQDGMVIIGRKLRLHLAFDAAGLGARKGDRIGLQLLYCDSGWTLAPESMERLTVAGTGAVGPRLSNRVEFVAP